MQNTKYFKGYIWNLRKSPDTLVNSEWQSVKQDEWEKVHKEQHNIAHIIVPISRFYEVMDVVPVESKLTLKNVINNLYNFYHRPLTTEQINRIKSHPYDTFDYKNDLLNKADMGQQVCYVDLLGECVHFEGIKKVQANIYELLLGS